jgi:hypothetical protein
VALPPRNPAYASSVSEGISTLDVDVMGRLTTPDLSDIAQYISLKLETLVSLSSLSLITASALSTS